MSVDGKDIVEIQETLTKIKKHIHSYDIGENSAEAVYLAIKDEVEA